MRLVDRGDDLLYVGPRKDVKVLRLQLRGPGVEDLHHLRARIRLLGVTGVMLSYGLILKRHVVLAWHDNCSAALPAHRHSPVTRQYVNDASTTSNISREPVALRQGLAAAPVRSAKRNSELEAQQCVLCAGVQRLGYRCLPRWSETAVRCRRSDSWQHLEAHVVRYAISQRG